MQSSTPFPQTKSEHTVSLIPNGLLLVAAQRKKSDLLLICVFYNRLGGWEPLSIYLLIFLLLGLWCFKSR